MKIGIPTSQSEMIHYELEKCFNETASRNTQEVNFAEQYQIEEILQVINDKYFIWFNNQNTSLSKLENLG
jgi:hypothetical protein